MLRPNTELTKETVMQEIPRYVDVETGTLVGEDKKNEALRKAIKYMEQRGMLGMKYLFLFISFSLH